MRRVFFALLALALIATACGGDSGATTTISAPTSTTSVIETTTTSPTTSMTQPSTSTTTVNMTTTTSVPGTTSTTISGRPIDFGPAEGDVLMVIGVRHDDVLNLRASPGADQPIVEEIPPTFTDLIAQGNTRALPASFWIQVVYGDSEGWVHLGYVGYEGDVTDDTASVIDDLGERPVESTMEDLGELIAGVYVSDDEPISDVVQVTPVGTGDLADVSFDVVGLEDDAVRGLRVHVFAEKVDGGFGLRSVETTLICGRGVDSSGACV